LQDDFAKFVIPGGAQRSADPESMRNRGKDGFPPARE